MSDSKQGKKSLKEEHHKEALDVLSDIGLFAEDKEIIEPVNHEKLKKILVIDDNKDFRELLKEIIEDEKTFEVLEAQNGQEALEEIGLNQDLSMLFVDLSMPEMNGFQLLQQAKSLRLLNNVPIIITTGFADEKLVSAAKSLGVLTYLLKPLNPQRVIEIISKIKS